MPSQSTGLKPRRSSGVVPGSRLFPSPFSLSPQSRQWTACLGMLVALCAANPAHAQADAASAALIEQGNYWQAQGRADLAEESWKKLLSVQPQSTDAMYGMAQVELSRGNSEAARTWIARLRTANPNDSRLARLQQLSQQPAGTQRTL